MLVLAIQQAFVVQDPDQIFVSLAWYGVHAE